MKLLLDTHALIWIVDQPERLSSSAREAILDEDNQLYLSAASYWEMSIKVSIGKLNIGDDWVEVFNREMRVNDIRWLNITQQDCLRCIELPFFHKDPFDRILISQAIVQNMVLVSADSQLKKYPIKLLW